MLYKYLFIYIVTKISLSSSLYHNFCTINNTNGSNFNVFDTNNGRFLNKNNRIRNILNKNINKKSSFSFINGNSLKNFKNDHKYHDFTKFTKIPEFLEEDNEPIVSELIRNFCIIAHVDHGKSTLADRFLEFTKSVPPERLKEQYLDNMELERERGITIKLQSARIKYNSILDGKTYTLNLIDTPGHIDFNHEARRSISACEGAILVVDGTKGIEAQTVTTANIAIEKGLKIIPVVNKIDLEHCDFKSTAESLKKFFGFKESDILKASAKKGIGIEDILEAVVVSIPPPKVDLEKPFRALVFDSFYDPYRGAICYIRVCCVFRLYFQVFEGSTKIGDEITLMNADITSKVTGLGIMLPEMKQTHSLQLVNSSGQVGWITAGIKKTNEIHVGDTISLKSYVKKNLVEPINKFENSKPTVFAGIYPCIGGDFDKLQTALEKLKLNDHSFQFERSDSSMVGMGFKCGFNGLLHLDITVERLEREFDTQVIVTSPSVPYRCTLRDKSVVTVDDASKWPDESQIKSSEEPWTDVTLRVPEEYFLSFINIILSSVGSVMSMLSKMRGRFKEKNKVKDTNMVVMNYDLPLSEILSDFFNKLKSVTNGYGSYDYEGTFYEPIELCKLKILLNGTEAKGLAVVTPRNRAYDRGKLIVETLVNLIPSRQFKVPVQAVIGKRVISSSNIPAVKKNVIEKCSGGDPSRKKKLLENQARVLLVLINDVIGKETNGSGRMCNNPF
ncbi:GTP-binding protein, LepA subfamily, putative [Theileria annulata]|uniref:Translation factor GUF1 homolog, mitochondrial n=1 Tax=Theileria annulata TaxID=5874 RepID=GUF1_THEAN|nr:GTP-binding protein, LepA subfamily, putative [Theileria annulata]Q4UIN6.1 RecName: Full=Translation factor GUF1 homolog, mitochondrial; AltName: Full=Elongation factor 4 homolog; Short=EF-4; AltName: Full=GTPase GUF1 homolog; AltName: Full=Ribosomal back-translocase [Theileria annulata]CAI73053.1 GTP-binding protein, LepA subfamily, putative [Theileria annulata]|eukprot:XP_953731.1 GTP-binding protein, LepA subfamily, putative [Theileria annulata]